MRWNNTVEAIEYGEQTKSKVQWAIGDAILKDLKENDLPFCDKTGVVFNVEQAIFDGCVTELAAKGIEYTAPTIRNLCRVAFYFSRSEREPKYSWHVHHAAGTPANLKATATALRKIKKAINETNVRALVSHWEDEADSKRKKEVERAKAKKTAAKKKKVKAAEDKLSTTDKTVRAVAETRRQEAQREIEEANAAIKELGGPPPFNVDLDVDTNDVSALERWALYLGITANAMHMKKLAQKTLKEVEKIAHLLTNNEQQHIADGCNDVIDIMEHINKLVKRANPKLRVVGGAS